MNTKVNLGSGLDLKHGWTNVDRVAYGLNMLADLKELPLKDNFFEFALLNHVICTMKPEDVAKVLKEAHRILKPGGVLQVIDMDILKVFQSYKDGRSEDIPIEQGSIDDKLCLAISGYGTRLSLYTPERMFSVLTDADFRLIFRKEESEYDTRPKESLVFEAIK